MADACLQCSQLNGQTFEDQDVFQHTLWSPFWGDIWDLDGDRPLTHGGTGINCRCQLEVRGVFDWTKIDSLEEMQRVLHGIF